MTDSDKQSPTGASPAGELSAALLDNLQQGTFLLLVLSRPHEASNPVRKLSIRRIELKAGVRLQFTRHEVRRETHANLSLDEAAAEAGRLFDVEFDEARLFTSGFDLTLTRRPNGTVKAVRGKPSKQAAPPATHDRRKAYLIPEGQPCPFLAAIGVMTADGQVRAAWHDKFRQINRFLEFVNDVCDELPSTGPLRVVDFGCGRSYLTFALHHLLTVIRKREVEITGLDLKADVIADCNRIANELQCPGLTFRAGDMAGFEPGGPIHLAVALHACDTATDMTLARAVAWQSRVILSVPCCHHEFASQLDGQWLASVQKHGLLRERFAELLTDAFRCQMLEASGYRTQALEFIELEHTPKNTLIRAVHRARPDAEHEAQSRAAAAELLQTAGIRHATLWELLTKSP